MKHIIIIFTLFAATPCVAQWQFIYGNLGTGIETLAFGVHDMTLFASESRDVNKVYRYISPQNWVETDSGMDFTRGSITTFAPLGKFFFAGSGPPNTGNGYIYTDNGTSWSDPIGGPIGTNGTYVFGQYATRIARSRDSGKTWEHLTADAGNSYAGSGLYVLAATPYGVYRSLDSGGTWAIDSTPLKIVNSFALIGILTFGANGPIIKSTDNGSHWTEITIPGRNVSHLVSGSTFLFAGTDSGVYVSLDSGTSWRAVSDGLSGNGYNPQVTALCVFDTLLVVGIDAGNLAVGYAAARPIREMVDTTKSGVQSVSKPTEDSIEVYPNPANGIVTILSGGTSILGVSVLNVLGEEVLTVSNERESEINLDISELASGTYFLQIQTASGVVLRKIVKED